MKTCNHRKVAIEEAYDSLASKLLTAFFSSSFTAALRVTRVFATTMAPGP